MSFRFVIYCWLMLGSLVCSVGSKAQVVAYGGPLVNVDFGDAPVYNISVPGPPLKTGITAIPYTADVCPSPGTYTVVSGITTACYDNKWIPLFGDNTPFPDNNGYMMLIHDVAHPAPQTIFEYAMRGMCTGVNYQFSAAVINLDKPTSPAGCTRFSSLTLQVEDDMGNIIGSTTTGDIEFAVFNMGYHFTKYKVDFMVPASANGIVVKIINESKAAAPGCSNGIAIDDIQVRVTGPDVGIGFDSTPPDEWVKSSCFQQNKSFTMHGSIDAGLVNPAIQWQRSNDDGVTWTDIAGATDYTYSQNFNVADTFLFRLRGSEASLIGFSHCGVFSNLLKVQVDGIPKNFSVTNNSPLCAGQDLIFNAAGGTSYLWTGPNGFSDNVSYAHIYHSALADSGRYYVKIFSLGGCSVVDSTDVKMLGVDVKVGNDTSICKGQSVHLRAFGASGYQWSPTEGLSDASKPDPVATPASSTTYTAAVINNDGCASKASVTITLRNTVTVKAAFTSPGYICKMYDSARFSDQSIGNITNWQWNFDNGQLSTLSSPPLQYYAVGNNQLPYKISLTVSDTAGCTDSVTQLLKIADNCYIAVPSAFTPNNDGLNDYLYPLNAYKATNLTFRVYNRVGQLVFETRDWTKKWDGSFNGSPLDAGVYVWKLRYDDGQKKNISLQGTTLLLR